MIWIINPIMLLLVYILYTKSSGIIKKLLTVFGGLLDVIVNITWFTVIFFERPQEWLLTQRVERLKRTKGYRRQLALIICKILNHYERNHCK